MLRERHINGDSGGRGRRALLAAADRVRWPFERAAWAAERAVLWPLQERFAGWAPPGRSLGAAALAVVAAAALLAGVLLLPGGGETPRERVAAPARVAIAPAEPQAEAEPTGPVLQGAPPDFDAAEGSGGGTAGPGGAKSGDADASAGGEGSSEAAPAAGDAAAGSVIAAGSSAAKKPVPAGPAAMKIARRFTEAFVFYEIGKRPARAKAVFADTATPQLAEALGKRPPRQPGEGEVPKAKVLNLVPGPRAGKAYTVSASLLRVGLTSELRIELSKKRGQWLVTDVRG
jgi:hypothetical protein